MPAAWHPSHADPVFIMAMDHRKSFGVTLFDVAGDDPTPAQAERMRHAKELIYSALDSARTKVSSGRSAVLVDERYGQAVIDRARRDGVVLAVPVEASGHDWFTLEWQDSWLQHVESVAPDYAKVLVRDNPDFDADARRAQLDSLAQVSAALDGIDVPLIYELLVPGTDEQLASVAGNHDAYDSDLRPGLTVRVIADNQAAGVHPGLWKLEGFETTEAAHAVAAQTHSGLRPADIILLGRDAPTERLDHWINVAVHVDAFVGFAIGRSIWEDPLRDYLSAATDEDTTRTRIADRFLHFAGRWTGAAK